MKKAVAKLFLFLLIISSFIFLVKKAAKKTSKDPISVAAVTIEKLTDSFVYFIGSSRVDMAIDLTVLDSAFQNTSFVKTVATGSTFLGNSIMASNIMEKEGSKIIFLELAALLNDIPNSIKSISGSEQNSLRTLLQITNKHSVRDQSMMLVNILNQKLFASVSIKSDIIEIFRKTVNEKEREKMEFDPHQRNNIHNTITFLNFDEISKPVLNADYLGNYLQVIDYLKEKAARNNTKLFFFLPLNYLKSSEKDIVVALFNLLPPSMRLNYSRKFMNQITKAEYLYDKNHLNKAGAAAYSRLLIPQIKLVIQ